MKKSTIRRVLALTLALAMGLSMSACALRDTPATSGNATSGNAAAVDDGRDEEVAVKIGDEFTVTRGDIRSAYDNVVLQYSYYGMTAPTADADVESMQDMVVDDLVSEKMIQYQAGLMGITLTDEELAQVDADTNDEVEEILAQFRATAESEGAADPDARAAEIFNEQLISAGLEMDMDGYRDYVREYRQKEAITAAVQKKIKAEVSASDEDAKAYYDDLKDAQKDAYKDDISGYQSDAENYEKFGGDPVLSIPEGYVRVRTITISPAADKVLDESYTEKSAKLSTLEAEYGKLMLENATKNAARIAEIKAEYAPLKAEADALYEDYIKDAKAKADEAIAALKGGKSFADVLAQYGEDDLYTTYPVFAEKGILIMKDADDANQTHPEIAKAVANLKPGEYTDAINAEDMFYICELVGDEPAGERTYEDVADEMLILANDQKAEEHWTEKQAEWKDDASIVTYFEDAYRDIGKQAA